MHPDLIHGLHYFRADLYGCFGRREDALFELADALLTAGRFPSLPHLSLDARCRRGWGSLYAALSFGHVAGVSAGGSDVRRGSVGKCCSLALPVATWLSYCASINGGANTITAGK